MKMTLILPKISKNYLDHIDDISDDEIKMLIDMLSTNEKYRLSQYENIMKDNLTRKRLFIFICNLIDFKTIKDKENVG